MDKVKIVFVLGEDGWDGAYSEGLWAERCPCGFVLDNIPFFKKGVCYGDLVLCKKLSDGLFEYVKTIKKSNNSLYRVLFEKEKNEDAQLLLSQIESLDCIYETNNLGGHYLVAINIPGNVDIDVVWRIIETGIGNETWEVQEGDDRHTKRRSSK